MKDHRDLFLTLYQAVGKATDILVESQNETQAMSCESTKDKTDILDLALSKDKETREDS